MPKAGETIVAEDGDGAPPIKKLRCQSPDVIVAVGSGSDTKEFGCYRVALAAASEYFDAMLSANMRENETSRIEFPDKDAEDWKLFYTFVDPATNRKALVTKANAQTLLPWFHEFGMEEFVAECDSILSKDILKICSGGDMDGFWFDKKKNTERRAALDEVLLLLSLSDRYNLSNSKEIMHSALENALRHGADLITLQDIERIQPFAQRAAYDEGESRHEPRLRYLDELVERYLSKCSATSVDRGNELFPTLLYSCIQNSVLQVDRDHLSNLVEDVVEDFPDRLSTRLEVACDRFSTSFWEQVDNADIIQPSDVLQFAERGLKRVIYDAWKDDCLVEVPASYRSGTSNV